jgi:hypothetical protein
MASLLRMAGLSTSRFRLIMEWPRPSRVACGGIRTCDRHFEMMAPPVTARALVARIARPGMPLEQAQDALLRAGAIAIVPGVAEDRVFAFCVLEMIGNEPKARLVFVRLWVCEGYLISVDVEHG